MNYHVYVRLLSQFSYKDVARVEVCERELVVSRKEERWQISTLLSQGEEIPRDLIHFSKMRWQKHGAYLKFDPLLQSLYLIHDVRCPSYLSLKALLGDFVSHADEWSCYLNKKAHLAI